MPGLLGMLYPRRDQASLGKPPFNGYGRAATANSEAFKRVRGNLKPHLAKSHARRAKGKYDGDDDGR